MKMTFKSGVHAKLYRPAWHGLEYHVRRSGRRGPLGRCPEKRRIAGEGATMILGAG